MPRPHYPAQGGPHLPAWNPIYARLPRRAQLFDPHASPDPPKPDLLKSDLPKHTTCNMPRAMITGSGAGRTPLVPPMPLPADTPQRGLAAARNEPALPADTPFSARVNAFKAQSVAWIAAGLCAAAALFAILAICRHG